MPDDTKVTDADRERAHRWLYGDGWTGIPLFNSIPEMEASLTTEFDAVYAAARTEGIAEGRKQIEDEQRREQEKLLRGFTKEEIEAFRKANAAPRKAGDAP